LGRDRRISIENGKVGVKRRQMTDMAQLATLIGPVFMPMEQRSTGGDKKGDRQNNDEARSLHQGTIRHTP